MTRREPSIRDLLALHGKQVTVVQVDVVEDVDGIPAWVDVKRETATVVIVPSLLRPKPPEDSTAVWTSRSTLGKKP